MNKLEPNDGLYFSNDFRILSQFSSGIEYCGCEQQIELLDILIKEEKKELTFLQKARQVFSSWKNWLIRCFWRQFDKRENDFSLQSQLLIKNISHETAWASSLLALTSLGVTSEIIHRWPEVNQNLSPESTSLQTPYLDNHTSFSRSPNQLFPLLTIGEIELVIWGNKLSNDLTKNFLSTTLNWWQINKSASKNWHDIFQLSLPTDPRKPQIAKKQLSIYLINSGSSLMAIPPLESQLSLAGFSSFLSTLEFTDLQKDSALNQSNSSPKNEMYSLPSGSDSVSSNVGGSLMAIPETVYQPYFPKVGFLGRKKN